MFPSQNEADHVICKQKNKDEKLKGKFTVNMFHDFVEVTYDYINKKKNIYILVKYNSITNKIILVLHRLGQNRIFQNLLQKENVNFLQLISKENAVEFNNLVSTGEN